MRADYPTLSSSVDGDRALESLVAPGRAALEGSGHIGEADELLAAMASIRRSGRRHARRPVVLESLNGSQLELVRLVRRRPGISVTDAAEELRLAPNTVSTLVSQLTEDGVLLRVVDDADRRVARLDLAEDARRKVDAWRDRRVEALAVAIDRLSRVDQRRLAVALPTLRRLAGLLTLGSGPRQTATGG